MSCQCMVCDPVDARLKLPRVMYLFIAPATFRLPRLTSSNLCNYSRTQGHRQGLEPATSHHIPSIVPAASK